MRQFNNFQQSCSVLEVFPFSSYYQAQFQLASPVPVELRLALSLIISNPTQKVEIQFNIVQLGLGLSWTLK